MIKLKNLFLLLFVTNCTSPTLFCQTSLTIEINGLKNSEGQVVLALSDEKGEKVSGIIQGIENCKCSISVNDIKPGKYAFKYFHDENKNMTLDLNWIGIPKEGFGFSNNARGTFGPPSFQKTIFEVTDNDTLKCNPTYF